MNEQRSPSDIETDETPGDGGSPDRDQAHPRSDQERAADEAYNQFENASPEGASHRDAPETRDEEMTRLREQANAADKRVLQAQAEAENFRKRMRRDYEDQLKFAAIPLVTDLLQVRDNLHRAIQASEQSAEAAGLQEGVAIVAKQLDETLAKHGIRQIAAEGELFDPNFHEAISQMPSDEVAQGMIAHVAVPGFQMHDRVVRPSQVIVSAGPAG